MRSSPKCSGSLVPDDGAAQLRRLGEDLNRVGDGDLKRELLRGLNRATKPLKEAARVSAASTLPRRGGLGAWVASAKVTGANRVAGRNVGVRISGKSKGHDLESIDRGLVRHPVFGRPQSWVAQRVRPGWWSQPMVEGGDEVRREVLNVLDDVTRRLADGG